MMSYKDRKIIFLVQDIPEKTCAKLFITGVSRINEYRDGIYGIYNIAEKTGRLPSSGL